MRLTVLTYSSSSTKFDSLTMTHTGMEWKFSEDLCNLAPIVGPILGYLVKQTPIYIVTLLSSSLSQSMMSTSPGHRVITYPTKPLTLYPIQRVNQEVHGCDSMFWE